MPKPIVCLSERLRQFLELFRTCCSPRQWKYFVIVLLGLVECEERKTLSGILRMIGEQVSFSGISQFLNKWSWSPEEVAETWLRHFRQRLEGLVQVEHARLKAQQPKRLGRPKQTVVTGFLIFDDSVHEKPKGMKQISPMLNTTTKSSTGKGTPAMRDCRVKKTNNPTNSILNWKSSPSSFPSR